MALLSGFYVFKLFTSKSKLLISPVRLKIPSPHLYLLRSITLAFLSVVAEDGLDPHNFSLALDFFFFFNIPFSAFLSLLKFSLPN